MQRPDEDSIAGILLILLLQPAGDILNLRPGLLHGAWPDAGDHARKAVGASIHPIIRRKSHGPKQLDPPIWEVKIRGHDADYCVTLVVEGERLPDDSRVGAEAPAP